MQAGNTTASVPDLRTLIWQMAVPYNYYCGPVLAKDGTMIIIGSGTEIKAFRPNRDQKPVADFTTDSVIVYAGPGLNFYDQSSFQPSSWQWSFPGGTPASSSDQNPAGIIYSVPGDYEVSLAVSNSLGTDSLVKTCYLTVLPPVSVAEDNQPSEFYLSQNYPNPFNPATVINYQLAMHNFVSLKVYDVLGNEAAVLVNEEKPAGKYEVKFDASSLASGVYFYKLTAGSFVKVRKMVLVR